MNRSIEMLPLYGTRIAGTNVQKLEVLRSNEIVDHFKIIVDGKLTLRNRIDSLMNELFDVISKESDSKKRNKILEIRRSILDYSKIIKMSNIELTTLLPQEIRTKIISLNELYQEQNDRINNYSKIFNEEILRLRRNLNKEIFSKDYLHGVRTASESLYDKLRLYENMCNGKIIKKGDKIEEAILNYFIRSITKTSPFATFTSVTIDNLKSKSKYDFEKKIHGVFDRYELDEILNNLKNISNVKSQLKVQVNPSLIIKNNSYIYYFEKTANETEDGLMLTWTLESTPIIDSTIKLVQSNHFKYEKVINELKLEYKVDNDVLIKFIDDLIQRGVLELVYPINELNHNYFHDAIIFLGTIENETVKTIVTFLKKIEQDITDYIRCSDYDEILSIHNIIKKNILSVRELIKLPLNLSSYIYEDTCLPKFHCSISDLEINSIYEDLNLLSQIGSLFFLTTQVIQLNMKHVFIKNWKQDESINLIEYFNVYSGTMIKHFAEKYNSEESNTIWNPFNLVEVEMLKQLQLELTKIFQQPYEENSEIVFIDKGKMKNVLNKTPKYIRYCDNFSVYLQKGKSNNAPWVLNEIRGGNLRYMSRFLYMRGDYNNGLSVNNIDLINDEENIYAEMGGIFGSNNNVHEPLTEYLMAYPNLYRSEGQKTIMVNELVIKLNSDGFPILFSPRHNKRIIPIHIGLHNERYFPKLYQFMMNFESAKPFIPKSNIMFRSTTSTDYKMMPRVMFGKIMLSRKKYYIRADKIPKKSANFSLSEYYIELNEWRINNNMPSKVFFIRSKQWTNLPDEAKNNAEKKGNKKDKNWSKPTYFDFENPLLVNQFPKYLSSMSQGELIVFEELYPDYNDLLISSSNESYVNEFLFDFKIVKD